MELINTASKNYVHESGVHEPLPIVRKKLTERIKGPIRQAFLDVNMAYQHESLREIAKKGGVDLKALEPGEFVLFVSGDRSAIKLFGARNTFIYSRAPKGHIISDMFT